MTSHHPAWTAFDPDVPPTLPDADPARGRVVAAVASPGAVEGGWAAVLASDLARGWSEAGLRVVLVDAGLEGPTVHEAVGVPNQEGLTDALVWGASVQRVAFRPDESRFFLITAGTAVADPLAAFDGPKWAHLCAGFRDAGVTLVTFVPSAESAASKIVAHADDVVVIAAEGEDLEAAAVDGGDAVVSVLGFPAEGAAPQTAPSEDVVVESEQEPESEDVDEEALEDPLLADTPADPVHADVADDPLLVDTMEDPLLVETPDDPLLAGKPVGTEDASATELSDPPSDSAGDAEDQASRLLDAVPESAQDLGSEGAAPLLDEIVEESEAAETAPKSSGRRRNGLLVFLLLLIVAVLVAAWLGYVDIPGITQTGGVSSSPVSATPLPAAEAPAETVPVATLVAYSLALGAYRDASVARARAAELSRGESGVVFASVPVEVDGTLYHRVLAGPAADSADAAGMAARVAAATGSDPSGWVIRATPKAFLVGEMPSLAGAWQQAEVLQGIDLPAYVLAVDYTDGSTVYRVYVGAYADESEASYLAGLLSERSLGATLTDRIGRLPE